MADTFSNIAKNASSMSVSELGSSLLGRKEAVESRRRKRDRKDMRISQVLGVLTAGQGLFKNAFKRRQKELANLKTLDVLNSTADATEIANISSILNVVPENYTKQINPLTNQAYTIEENVQRFFDNPTLSQSFISKTSPIVDSQIKFSNESLETDNPSMYRIIQNSAAKDIFKYMITDDRHITFLDGLKELYTDQKLSRQDLLRNGLGITENGLNKIKTQIYSNKESNLRNNSGILSILHNIGKDREKEGELNVFKNISNKDVSTPTLDEILKNINLKGIVIPAYDKGMQLALTSKNRYLSEAKTPKNENARENVMQESLPNLHVDIDNNTTFIEGYGYKKIMAEDTINDLKRFLKDPDNVSLKYTFTTRVVALSERLKDDPRFSYELLKMHNIDVKPQDFVGFLRDLETDEFRNKFSTLMVLHAGRDVGFFGLDDDYLPPSQALASMGLGNDYNNSPNNSGNNKFNLNESNIQNFIDPLIQPMFNNNGKATVDYHKLPTTQGKIFAYDMQVNTILTSTLTEPEKNNRLETFFQVEPNPRNASNVETYIEEMQNDTIDMETNREKFGLVTAPNMKRLNELNRKYNHTTIGYVPRTVAQAYLTRLEKDLPFIEKGLYPIRPSDFARRKQGDRLLLDDPTKEIKYKKLDFSPNEIRTRHSELQELAKLLNQHLIYTDENQTSGRSLYQINQEINDIDTTLNNPTLFEELKPSEIKKLKKDKANLIEKKNNLEKNSNETQVETSNEPKKIETITYASGAKYVGEIKNDSRNGQGTITFADGGKYVGEFQDGNYNGQGTYTWVDGSKYVGEFQDDKRHGQGTFAFDSGANYVGEYKDGKRHGQGIYTYADGTIKKGIWENGSYKEETTGPYISPINSLTMNESNNNANALWLQAQTDTFKDQPPVTEQTLAQIMEFTAKDGDYANWSKEQLNPETGKKGGVHTPVGKYQFVGNTLRDIKTRKGFEELGFDENTLFTEQNQDKLFEWYINRTIKDATNEAEKKGTKVTQQQIRNKIRGRWSGIKTTDQMSDEELDGIISQVQDGTYTLGDAVETNYSSKKKKPIEQSLELNQELNQDLFTPRKVGKDLALEAINLVTSLSEKESPEYVENLRNFLGGLVNNESVYGTHEDTFDNPNSNATGPFQIKDGKIGDDLNLIGYYGDVIDVLSRDTGRGESVRAYNEQLKNAYGIDLSTAKPKDLNKMIYAAAFARAGLLLVDPPIPTDPVGHAYYYADYYHKGENRDKIAMGYLLKNKEYYALSSVAINVLMRNAKGLLDRDK